MKGRIFCLWTALLLALTGCAMTPADPDTARESIQVIAMDTAMLITTYGERSSSAAYACEDVIRDLEAKLSRTVEDSEVSRLNAAGGGAVEIGWDAYSLLERAALTAPPPVGPLISRWPRWSPPGASRRTASASPLKRSWTGFSPW